MTDKELKRLSRGELLEMLIQQSKELELLRKQLNAAQTALQNREIAITNAGSIAEAALQLNGVFTAAQDACQQYMENICHLSQNQERICAQRDAESQAEAKRIVEEARKESEALEHETRMMCAEMVTKAKAESQAYWDEVSRRLVAFSTEHAELQQLLSAVGGKE
ncbi:MAG: hypothetical protein ACI3VI_02135 [Vescimonas sp.]